ncbi:hypothetical protein QL285_052299 [Trifolium repens]|nr:hypothetical protein QL285_052299 [Trifolium repens]
MEFLVYLDCASRYQDLPERAWPSDHVLLLLRRRCWSFSNGEFVKAGIDVMRQQVRCMNLTPLLFTAALFIGTY